MERPKLMQHDNLVICGSCDFRNSPDKFKHSGIDPTDKAECPQCGTQEYWYKIKY